MITAALIFSWCLAPGSAFVVPNAAPRLQARKVSQIQNSDSSRPKNTEFHMADVSYALDTPREDNRGSFLFQYSDWPYNASLYRRNNLARSFSFFDEEEFSSTDGADSSLRYLPYAPEAPLTNEFLKELTSIYVSSEPSSQHSVDIPQFLNVITDEYKSDVMPVRVGDQVFEDEKVSEIMSFAALYRLPKQLALMLFEYRSATGESMKLQECRALFEFGGWESVEFPIGLGICLQKQFRFKSDDRYAPSTWRFMRRRKRAALYAQVAVDEAALTTPPPKRVSRTEFLKSMQQELVNKPSLFQDSQQLLFFPQRSRVSKIWKGLIKSVPRFIVFRAKQTLRVAFRVARALARRLQSLFARAF